MSQTLEEHPDDDFIALPESAVVSDDEEIDCLEEESPAERPTHCPRCQTKLTNPEGLGWCSKCGYCRSLEVEGKNLPDLDPKSQRAAQPSPLGANEFLQVLRMMPSWVWVLLVGLVGVFGASMVVDDYLPEASLERALWSALQMVVCFGGLIGIQLWAILSYGAEDDGLAAKDIIMPGRVWRVVIRRLPASCGALWLGAWCLTGILCAAFVIGGFEFWLPAPHH